MVLGTVLDIGADDEGMHLVLVAHLYFMMDTEKSMKNHIPAN